MVSEDMTRRIVVKNATPLNVLAAFSEMVEKASPEERATLQAQLRESLLKFTWSDQDVEFLREAGISR